MRAHPTFRLCRVASVPFHMRYLDAQLHWLNEAGVAITTVTSSGTRTQIAGIRHEVVEMSRKIEPWADAKAVIAMIRVLRSEPFAICHSNTPKGGIISAVAALICRVPVRLHTWTGQPWMTMEPGAKRLLMRTLDRVIGLLSTCCYADSESQRAMLVAERIAPAHKLRVLGPGSLAGVNLDRFRLASNNDAQRQVKSQALGIAGDGPTLVFVGRLTAEKGIRELLAAFEQIRQQVSGVTLLLVGPLDDELGGVSNLSSDALKAPGIIWVGFAERPEDYLAISDVLMLPSYREGFPNVVLEAAALGLPAIGTDIVGMRDTIVHEQTGLLVEVKSVSALAGAMRRLVDDEELRLRLGAAAAQRAELFSSELLAEHTLSEYRHQLTEARRRAVGVRRRLFRPLPSEGG
jgi:glycosyltransferase involved in cell wall biosynthesis